MYVKTTSRRIKDGAEVRYLHLAHNQWDPARQRSVPQVLNSFGREDTLDRDAIRRLVASLSRLLDPADALAATAGSDLAFPESRPAGGVHVPDALRRRLNIGTVMAGAGQKSRGRPRDNTANERVLSGLVASRRSSPPRNWPRPTGSTTTSISPASPPPPMTPATGRWTGCMRSGAKSRRRSTTRSLTC
jgi:hypothetical protein